MKSDYRYSAQIVYNNFPWPGCGEASPAAALKRGAQDRCGEACSVPAASAAGKNAAIEATAQAILDARAKYPDATLADLYDELAMPPELRRAHQANDRDVMAAYGFKPDMTESECVAELFKLYQVLVRRH